MLARLLLAALLAIAVVGAAHAQGLVGPPWPVVVAPNGITLRWYADNMPEAVARQVADAHCAPTGRPAALAALEMSGSAEIGTYVCR